MANESDLAEDIARRRADVDLTDQALDLEQTSELSYAKNRLEAILNNSTDGILLVYSNMGIQQSNAAFNSLFSCREDDYFGKPLTAVVCDEYKEIVTTTLHSVRTTRQGKTIEVHSRRFDGKVFDAELGIGFLGAEDNGEAGFVCTIWDITELKRRERQLRFNASLQENVTDAVVSTDMNFTIQSWNGAAERIYGWSAKEVIGQNSGKLFKTQFGSGHTLESFQQELLNSGKWQSEVVQVRKDGTKINVLSSINVFKDENGNPLGVVGINHDITARKQADEALQLKIENELEFQIYLKALHEISVELTQIDHLNDFYRRVVELGLERLGYDRLALFLYDKDNHEAIGTFGTGAEGFLTDERHLRWTPGPEGAMMRTFQRAERFCYDEDAELHQDFKTIGMGWNASAALWNGTQSIGWLVADNFIHKQPASKALLDTLALYAMTVGTLLARKQTDTALRESETRYRLLAENISDVIIRLNTVGELSYVSPSSYTVLGYRPEEMVGQSGFNFVYSEDLAIPAESMSLAMTGEDLTKVVSFRFRHKQGHPIWVEATGQTIYSAETGEIQEFIASLRDISERKRAEEAIRQAFEKEKELGELKSRFVSMTSHEFRTPLANILATTETLSNYRQKMTDQQIERRLDNIRGQVDHLKDIMDDVLQLTRIDIQRVEYNPQPLNLDALCKEIVDEFDIRADVPNQLIYTSQNVPFELHLDKKLMRQIVNNLISNAVKYSPADKPVKLSLASKENICILTVSDEGIGIPEADLKHMFEPFHRATNVGTISGTGLGLIITRKAVELHGGTIALQSQLGIGTMITVEIPVDTQKEKDRGENSGD